MDKHITFYKAKMYLIHKMNIISNKYKNKLRLSTRVRCDLSYSLTPIFAYFLLTPSISCSKKGSKMKLFFLMVSPSRQLQFRHCHRSVTFVVTLLRCCHCCCVVVVPLLSQFHCPHCSVTFIVALLWFHRCHCGVAFAFVTVSLSPSPCHLRISHSFIVAVAVLPSCWLWFRCCHRGVAFIIALSRCHRCSCVIVVPSQLHCRGFVVAIAVLPSSSHCCHFVIAIVVSPSCWLQFRHCHCGVAFVIALLWCCCHSCVVAVPSLLHCCGFIITIAVLPSSLHHHGVVVTILLSLLLLRCGCCCCCCGCVVVVGMSQLSWLSLHHCGCIVVIVIVTSEWLWLWLWL